MFFNLRKMNKDLVNLYELFIINKINIYVSEGKTEYIILGSKQNLKKAGNLNILYHEIEKTNPKKTARQSNISELLTG